MSTQLFSGQFFLPTSTLTNASAGSGAQQASSNTIDGGPNTGNIFIPANSDFFSPNKTLKNVDSFSNSFSNGNIIFGNNPDPLKILNVTNSRINKTFSLSPNFGSVPVIPYPFAQPVPDLGVNPGPNNILAASTFFQQGIQSPYEVPNPLNFNPLTWQNPSADNILFGSVNAYSSLLNNQLPFPGGFPNSLVPFFNPPAQSSSFPPFINSIFGNPVSFGVPFGQSTSMQPFQALVGLLGIFQSQGYGLSGQLSNALYTPAMPSQTDFSNYQYY